MITFVSYYIRYPDEMLSSIQSYFKAYCSNPYTSITNPNQLITAMFESVKQQHPTAQMILITDESTKLKLPKYIQIVRLHRQTNHLKIEIIRAILYSLEKYSNDRHVFFLDIDMIIRDNLEHVFEREGDMFLTFHNVGSDNDTLESEEYKSSINQTPTPPVDKSMIFLWRFPINLGFIAFRKGKKEVNTKLFQTILTNLCRYGDKRMLNWGGVQLILYKMLLDAINKLSKLKTIDNFSHKICGVNIGFLDGLIYNFTSDAYHHIPLGVKIVHFKSSKRKMFMIKYWDEQKKLS